MITLNLSFATVGEMHMALTAMLAGTSPAALPVAAAKVEAPKPVKTVKPAATPAVSETATPAPAPAPAQPEPAAESPSEPVIALEEVRAVLARLSQAGKAPAVKALIADAGFSKLTDIPAEQYRGLLAKAAAL